MKPCGNETDSDYAVFIDRDGVITEDPPHYAHRLDQLQIIPGSAKAIQRLNVHNVRVIVITNQSGVARGYYTEDDVKIFNEGMKVLLAKEGAHVDAIYYCPHHPDAMIERYRLNCECRKPKPGMLFSAASQFDINLAKSFVVGDKGSDIRAGEAAGCNTILVLTGHGKDEVKNMNLIPKQIVAKNLSEAVDIILIKWLVIV
jgi:D-glycero-D-manno-heptose 1,7-bisphosphate phosphatase